MFEADDFDGFFRTAIGRHTGYWPDKIECSAAGSSTFSQTARVKTENGLDVFIKCSEHVPEDAYAAEAEGLQMLASHTDMHIPEVVGTGTIEGKNYIILQFVGTTQAGALYWLHFGRGLATLHACTATRFGYHKSNYLGLLPQRNAWNTSFDVFFVEERLRIQAGLAVYNGYMESSVLTRFDNLYKLILSGYFPKEKPSLLHGDLWSGNVWCTTGQKPVLSDPALHFGHREYELAFSMLFGGFDASFYTAYEEVFPLQAGFSERVPAYHLYPLLVHLNMFGDNYLPLIFRNLAKLGC